jgi:hypothetical protein
MFTEIDCPSGKLVVSDDLRMFFPEFDGRNSDHSIDTMKGRHDYMREYEKLGMAHGYVGSTDPSVWRPDDGRYFIANAGVVETEEDCFEPIEKMNHLTKLCEIDTYLWWYSMADLKMLEGRGFTGEINDFHGVSVIDVEPGRYRFKTLSHMTEEDPVILGRRFFGLFERIGECS